MKYTILLTIIFTYKVKVKLATVSEGDPKAFFSLAAGGTPFPGLLHFTLDP